MESHLEGPKWPEVISKLLTEMREITPAVWQAWDIGGRYVETLAVIVITTHLGKQSAYLYQIHQRTVGRRPFLPYMNS